MRLRRLGPFIALLLPPGAAPRSVATQSSAPRVPPAAGRPVPGGRTPARDRAAVRALEEEWLTAQDAPTLGRILAADFRHPVPTGDVLTKAQHIAWVTAHPRPPFLRPRFAALEIRVFGDAAVADGSVVTDSGGRVVGRTVFTDVFLYRGGRWQAVSAQETTVTGGPARPNGRPLQ